MKEKINIAELLKDCPKGTKLYSPLCGECRVIKVYNYLGFDVINGTDDVFNFSYDGRYNLMGECCIFPSKDQRDWSKFQRPFKDGDIVAFDSKYGTHLFIFKEYIKCDIDFARCHVRVSPDENIDLDDNGYYVERLATEEEKEKLFQVIKDNGYVWNTETKTLEKLPKFKVGDRVRNKNYKDYIYDIHDITDKGYRAKEINADSPIIILFGSQEDNYELVPNKFDTTTLVPFESRVLVRSSMDGLWKPAVFGFRNGYNDNAFYIVGGSCWKQCIPYMNNEHLCGTTNDCDEYFKTWEK